MANIKSFLLLTAIAFTVRVSATAPPGHGVVKESKSTVCPYLDGFCTTLIVSEPLGIMYSKEICYIEPVRNWVYVDVVPSLYTAPHVDRPSAFFARSSC